MVLEDEADPPAAEGGQLPLVEFGRIDAVQQHAAAGWGFQRAQDAQERALARAAGAEDRQVLARIERQRHAAEDLDRLGPRGILLGDVFDLKFGHGNMQLYRPQTLSGARRVRREPQARA